MLDARVWCCSVHVDIDNLQMNGHGCVPRKTLQKQEVDRSDQWAVISLLLLRFLCRSGNNGNSNRLYFLGLPKSLQIVTEAMKLKDGCSLEEKP